MILCGMLVAGLLPAAAADSAEELRILKQIGKPGRMEMPPVYGYGGSLSAGPNVMRFAPRSIDRSPGAPRSPQNICVMYRIERLYTAVLNRWEPFRSATACARDVPVGFRAPFAAWDFYPPDVGFSYHAKVSVVWAVGNKRIAGATVDYNTTGDYRCETPRWCTVDYGFRNVAYMSFSF